MTKKEKLLAGKLLLMASRDYGRHICNDLTEEITSLFTQAEWDAFRKEYHDWNGDPEEYQAGRIFSYDWAWMHFMGAKLIRESEND